MLHKGKLQAALNLKRGQFTLYDGAFSEQLQAYRHALETLCTRYASSVQLERVLPPEESGVAAGARPSSEFDRWLISAAQRQYRGPIVPFGREFSNHEQARQWAECIEGVTTIAVDGSQLQPWRDASIPVALVQVGLFANPHMQGRPYTKDVRIEVLTPDEIMEESKAERSEPDGYPYSEMLVTLRRYLLEIETLCNLMEQYAHARRSGDPLHSPVVFFDGSLVVSFATAMPSPYRERYVDSAIALLKTSEQLRIPLIGYIDTSYARDIITMLRRLDSVQERPVLRETKRIHDALLWQGRLRWGDRTPAMICARGDVNTFGVAQDRLLPLVVQATQHGDDVTRVAGGDIANEGNAQLLRGLQQRDGGGNIAFAVGTGHGQGKGDDERAIEEDDRAVRWVARAARTRKLLHLAANRLHFQAVAAQRDLHLGIGVAVGVGTLDAGLLHDLVRREHFNAHVLRVRATAAVRVGEETDLDERDGDGGVTPGLQLAAIHRQRGDALDALRPAPRLFVIGKFAPERNEGAGIVVLIGLHEPAIKLNSGPRSRRHRLLRRRQSVFQLAAGSIGAAQRLKRVTISPQLVAVRAVIERELPAFLVQCRQQLFLMKHARAPFPRPSPLQKPVASPR